MGVTVNNTNSQQVSFICFERNVYSMEKALFEHLNIRYWVIFFKAD